MIFFMLVVGYVDHACLDKWSTIYVVARVLKALPAAVTLFSSWRLHCFPLGHLFLGGGGRRGGVLVSMHVVAIALFGLATDGAIGRVFADLGCVL